MKYSPDQLFTVADSVSYFKQGLWLITTLFADLNEQFSRIFTEKQQPNESTNQT